MKGAEVSETCFSELLELPRVHTEAEPRPPANEGGDGRLPVQDLQVPLLMCRLGGYAGVARGG